MGKNKDSAISFLRLAASGRVREAFDTHVAAGFRHHNPFFAGDTQGLMAGMDENARQFPNKRFDIHRALEDGDFVAVHSHVRQTPADRGSAVVHIFRFSGERIAELWDMGMAVPAESVNTNGMF